MSIALSIDNKRMLKYLGIIFLTVLMGYKLPHDTYSIIEYIVRPIRFKGTTVYLAGLLPLVLLIIGVRGLANLERYAKRSTLLIFFAVIIILIPTMKGILDFGRTNYYRLTGDRLQAVDIKGGSINLGGTNNQANINFNLELIDYSRGRNEFKVRAYFPKVLREYTGKEFYTFDGVYVTGGNKNPISIKEKMTIKLEYESALRSLFDLDLYEKDVVYELYNEKEVVKVIARGR